MRFNHAGQWCDDTGQVVGLETDCHLLPPPDSDGTHARCSLPSYCAAPGYQNGVNCRAEQGFKWTSDDWCGCKCHVAKPEAR